MKDVPNGYEDLYRILMEALDQSARGKGLERHATEAGGVFESFKDQQICQLGRWMQSNHGCIQQVCKKSLESTRLDFARAKKELLGAIVYAAAAVLILEERECNSGV